MSNPLLDYSCDKGYDKFCNNLGIPTNEEDEFSVENRNKALSDYAEKMRIESEEKNKEAMQNNNISILDILTHKE